MGSGNRASAGAEFVSASVPRAVTAADIAEQVQIEGQGQHGTGKRSRQMKIVAGDADKPTAVRIVRVAALAHPRKRVRRVHRDVVLRDTAAAGAAETLARTIVDAGQAEIHERVVVDMN